MQNFPPTLTPTPPLPTPIRLELMSPVEGILLCRGGNVGGVRQYILELLSLQPSPDFVVVGNFPPYGYVF